ncbi:MAG: Mu transposase C-terminal domain-containing protein [Pseudomonas sp.]
MQTFLLKARLVVIIRGVRMSLHRRLIDRRLLFVDELGEPTKLSEGDFYLGYQRHEIQVCADQPYLGVVPYVRNVAPDLTCFPTKHSEEALRRRKYITGVLEDKKMLPGKDFLQKKIDEIAKLIEDACKPSISTLRRWISKFRDRNVVSLVPKHADKGRSNSITGELKDVLDDVIAKYYLLDTRPTVSSVVGAYHHEIDLINSGRLPSRQLIKPCGMTVRRYIAKLDPYEVDVHRLGKFAAKKKHRAAVEILTVDGILDRWEIDHTLLDVLLVDDETGLVIGRPYFTVVLDKFSRMVMGYLLHLSAPNTETVLRVIERSIRPKAELLKRFPKVEHEWRAHGLPARLVPDNAAEFHSRDMISGFNELGIEIMYPRSRGPELKGSVERFFRTQNMGFIHNLPGTTFSNSKKKGDYKSEKHACFTLPQLEAGIVKWIVDGYHQTPHRGLDLRTPAQVWAADEPNRQVRLPVDPDALECILARRATVKVHHYGIQIAGHGYHSPELAELILRLGHGEKVSVRYRDEIGHVWVHDRFRNLFLMVPIKDKRLLGMSRELLKAAKEKLRELGKTNPSFEQLHKCHRDLQTEIKGARQSQKMRERRAAALAKFDKEGRYADSALPTSVSAEIEPYDQPSPAEKSLFKVTYRHPGMGG